MVWSAYVSYSFLIVITALVFFGLPTRVQAIINGTLPSPNVKDISEIPEAPEAASAEKETQPDSVPLED